MPVAGYAEEYAEAMWLILQHETSDDYVLATGTCYTVEEFTAAAFSHVGLEWQKYVDIDHRFVRPADPHSLLGGATKARLELGWVAKTKMPELARMMVDDDLQMLRGKP